MQFSGVSRSEVKRLPGTWLASLGDPRQSQTREPVVRRKTFFGAAGENAKRALLLLGETSHSMPDTAEHAFCGVIFDGVLYNRAELRDRFVDSSAPAPNDAELVLQAYLYWGEDVLRQLKGIFALLIWDSKRDMLLCARDPLGVYPLFYADTGCEMLFSTSTEALIQHPRVSGTVNRAALADLLVSRRIMLEETFFANVSRVPPGHAMQVGSDRRVYRYWVLPVPGAGVDWVNEDELGQFDELMDQAVNRCLELGPAGLYLSGGLDSVTVAAITEENSRRQGLPVPWALSLVFPHADCNEEATQRGVATSLGIPQELISLEEAVGSKGLLLSALEMSRGWPAPLHNVSLPAYHHLGLQAKRRGCQVILTGGGGDEWLTVTPVYAAELLRALNFVGLYRLMVNRQRSYRLPRLALMRNILWNNGVQLLWNTSPMRASARALVRRVAPGVLEARHQRRLQAMTPAWLAPDPELRRELDQRLEQRWQQSTLELKKHGFYFRDVWSLLDHSSTTLEEEEVFESGRRMGLRVLQPFWDAELIELLYRTPPHLLNKGGRSKGLVRQMLARRFPDLGFERQKKVVLGDFLRSKVLESGMDAWQKLGGVSALTELGVVDVTIAKSTVEEIIEKKQSQQAYRIWSLLNCESWLQPRL